MSLQLTLREVAAHSTKKDVYVVVHDKVYNATSFVNEHPGGEEVLLDVGGQDATEAFEDVGHSDEAREILDGLLVGTLKRAEGDPPAKSYTEAHKSAGPVAGTSGGGMLAGMGLYAVILVGGVLAFGGYQYLQSQRES